MQTKSRTLRVRVTEPEARALDKAAERLYLNRSEMLRALLRHYATRLELWPPDGETPAPPN